MIGPTRPIGVHDFENPLTENKKEKHKRVEDVSFGHIAACGIHSTRPTAFRAKAAI